MVLTKFAFVFASCLFLVVTGLKCPKGKKAQYNVCVCEIQPAGSAYKSGCSLSKVLTDQSNSMAREACSRRGYPRHKDGTIVDGTAIIIRNKETTKYKCDCDEGWFGEECENVSCENDGVQSNKTSILGPTCDCLPEFQGNRCEKRDCGHGNWIESKKRCSCKRNWGGNLCKIPKCLNGGRLKMETNFTEKCDCGEWYDGLNCEYQLCEGWFKYKKECICGTRKGGKYCEYQKCKHGKRNLDYSKDESVLLRSQCVCEGKWIGHECDLCLRHKTWDSAGNEYCCGPGKTGKNCEKKSNKGETKPGAKNTQRRYHQTRQKTTTRSYWNDYDVNTTPSPEQLEKERQKVTLISSIVGVLLIASTLLCNRRFRQMCFAPSPPQVESTFQPFNHPVPPPPAANYSNPPPPGVPYPPVGQISAPIPYLPQIQPGEHTFHHQSIGFPAVGSAESNLGMALAPENRFHTTEGDEGNSSGILTPVEEPPPSYDEIPDLPPPSYEDAIDKNDSLKDAPKTQCSR